MTQIGLWAAIFLVYVAAGKAGLALAFINASASAVWAPTGLAIAAVLLFGLRVWPAIFLGAFLVNTTTSGSVATSLAIAAGNTLEALAADYLVERFAGGRAALSRGSGIFLFVLLAGLASTAISATIGVSALSAAGFARPADYRSLWLTWWLGDAVGAIVVAPVILCWAADPHVDRLRARLVELSLAVAALVGVGAIVFVGTDLPVGFLTLPVCIWIAFRFGQREATTATCVLSVLATWATVHGYGSLAATQSPNTALLLLQMFMAVITIVGLSVGAGVQGRARANEQRFKTIVEMEPACVKLVSADGRLLEMNPAGLAMLGVKDMAQVVGQQVAGIVHAEDRERFAEALGAASAGLPQRLQFRIVGADGGQRWVDSHMVRFETPARNASGRGTVLAVTSDITAQRSLEDQLRQAQKLDALGRLVGSVAHDFNNFLTALVGYTELALRQIGDDEQHYPDLKNDLKEVLTVGRRATALTKQLLIFSRRPMLDPQPVGLDGVVGPLGSMLTQLLGENVRVRVALGSGDAHVRVDPSNLEQIVVNLAVNARDAMPRGGEVAIATSIVQIDQAVSEHDSLHPPPGTYVRLTVSDTGAGMDDHVKAHLFEPFFTTKPSGQGTGLGLATVYGIVKQSGGYVRVASDVGQGTTFTIDVPVVPEAPPQVETQPAIAPLAKDDHATVLVVDDDEHVRAVARDVLREAGYRVLEARTGEEAALLASGCSSALHLVVTDVVLPGMNGRDLVDRLRRVRPELRALFISGYGQQAIVHHRVLDADDTLLEKPFSSAQLVAYVRAALAGEVSVLRQD